MSLLELHWMYRNSTLKYLYQNIPKSIIADYSPLWLTIIPEIYKFHRSSCELLMIIPGICKFMRIPRRSQIDYPWNMGISLQFLWHTWPLAKFLHRTIAWSFWLLCPMPHIPRTSAEFHPCRASCYPMLSRLAANYWFIDSDSLIVWGLSPIINQHHQHNHELIVGS